MIRIEVKVFEHGPAGLQLRVQARGEARSQREQIYYEELRRAIEGAILAAGAKVAELGLAQPLEAEVVAALQASGSSPVLEDTGIRIELPATAGAIEPPAPPRFSEFSQRLLQDLAGVVAQEREANLCDQAVEAIERSLALVTARCAAFAAQAARFAEWAAKQQAAAQRN